MTAEEARAELLRRKAQTDLLAFLAYCWWMPTPLKVGRHTVATCNRLTKAIDDYLDFGKTTYLLINMPFRHGKSDIMSRALPAFFLGRCAAKQPNVIMSGYGASLIEGFSQKTQEIVRSEAYQRVFPEVKIEGRGSAAEWRIRGSQSTVYATGLGGSITGKGANLIDVDDYCKNREEAESKSQRDKLWASFKDDLMTRLNPGGGLVAVCATRWHLDDISGRILEAMKRDRKFPRFEELVFPARKAGDGGWETLFPELYDREWYDTQRATLGTYSAAALLDCEPVSDATKEFKDGWLCYYDTPPPRETMGVYLFVDPSSGKKKEAGREKSDRTAMEVWGFGADGNDYLLDMVYDRMNLEERTRCAFDLYATWRPAITFYEQIGMQADIEHIIGEQNRLGWHFSITPLPQKVAKETRIRSLQPGFENHRIWFPKFLRKQSYADGRIYFPVQEMVEEEYRTFPGCVHDDGLDCMAHTRHPLVAGAITRPLLSENPFDRPESYRANTAWKR